MISVTRSVSLRPRFFTTTDLGKQCLSRSIIAVAMH